MSTKWSFQPKTLHNCGERLSASRQEKSAGHGDIAAPVASRNYVHGPDCDGEYRKSHTGLFRRNECVNLAVREQHKIGRYLCKLQKASKRHADPQYLTANTPI